MYRQEHLKTTITSIHSRRRCIWVECKNGHTKSDAVMILPKECIPFIGDLLFDRRHPYLGDGNPSALINTLDKNVC